MGTRKNNKKSNKKNRKTRSKKQKGSGATCSRLGQCTTDQNNIEGDPNSKDDYLRQMILDEHAVYVEMYLEEGANPNIMITYEHEYLQQPQTIPAIIYAARHIEPSTILKHLVNHGAPVEQDDVTDATKLAAGDYINILNEFGTTPLIEATEWGNLPAVRYLLKKGANINATTGSGVTAIGYAILNEDIPMIKLMLKERKGEIDLNYTLFDEELVNVIDEAIENDTNPEVIQILKDYANEIKHEKLKVARRVTEKGKNKYGKPLLTIARRDAATMIGDFLGGVRKHHRKKKHGIKTRSKRQRGGADEQELVRERDDNIIRVSSFNDEDVRIVIGDLLREGVSPVAKNTALLRASENGHTEIVEMLLEKGANVNAVQTNGITALMRASEKGHTETVERLLEKGAKVNAVQTNGMTALIWASRYGNLKTVEMLLNYGAKVNAESNYGQTALHTASQNGHTDIVIYLLQNGADVNPIVMNMPHSQRVNTYNNTKIVDVLEQHIKFKNLLDTLKENTENNENVQPLSKLSLDSLNSLPEEERILFTEFAARNSWNINYETGKIVPYSHRTRGGKRKTKKAKKSKRKTRKNHKKK